MRSIVLAALQYWTRKSFVVQERMRRASACERFSLTDGGNVNHNAANGNGDANKPRLHSYIRMYNVTYRNLFSPPLPPPAYVS